MENLENVKVKVRNVKVQNVKVRNVKVRNVKVNNNYNINLKISVVSLNELL